MRVDGRTKPCGAFVSQSSSELASNSFQWLIELTDGTSSYSRRHCDVWRGGRWSSIELTDKTASRAIPLKG